MKESNYCSLEVSKRLVDVGIEIDTECQWIKISQTGNGCDTRRYVLSMCKTDGFIPAPTFVEIWAELPKEYNDGVLCMMATEVGVEVGYYSYNNEDMLYSLNATNPADAAAELLIWVKEKYVR